MSASDGEGSPESGHPSFDDGELSAEDHAYFLAIEKLFNRFAERTHLLAPADWHVARRWRRKGIPLELVERGMAHFFQHHREQHPHDPIHSLRRLAPAVEAEWRQVGELQAAAAGQGQGEGAAQPAPFDPGDRLRALAEALPEDLPHGEQFAERIEALAVEEDPERIEGALAALDEEILEAAAAGLDAAQRAGIEAAVTVSLRGLASRLPAAEIARARERLRRQVLRERLGLPLLSLF